MAKHKKNEKILTLKDYIEIIVAQFIEYDNIHHCFQWFSLAFSIFALIFNIIILNIVVSTK